MAQNLFQQLAEVRIPDRVFEAPRAPETVTSFLGRLTLLHGVPFAYLVAHERLLPPESLKFFSIDPQWINALLGGAVSVGRPQTVGFLLNKAMAGNFGVLKEARTRRFRDRGLEPPKHINYDAPSYEFSGFLLRSRILEGWPGLEVRAFRVGGDRNVPTDELAMLRLDRVAADTLFAVVDGQIGILELTQPPEGLHFEVEQPPKLRDKLSRVLNVKELTAANGSAQFADRGLEKGEPVRVLFNLEIAGRADG
jgi:hypothetical protein